jgi:hypothetical protein
LNYNFYLNYNNLKTDGIIACLGTLAVNAEIQTYMFC